MMDVCMESVMDTCMDSADAAAELSEESMMMISSESEMLMIGELELPWTDSIVVEGVGGGGAMGFEGPEPVAAPGTGAESESL